MRHGRSPHNPMRTVCTVAAVAAAAAPAVAGAAQSHASAIAERVANATDAQLVIAMRQQLGPSYAEITYSDAPKRISAEFIGSKLSSGDIKGRWFSRTAKSCYSATREPFVGLASIGASLLPQGAGGSSAITYRQLASRELQWTIAATSQHGLEQGTVWFNSRDLIVEAHDRSYKSGRHGTAQATTVTLTYPKSLPASVPAHLPAPVCKR